LMRCCATASNAVNRRKAIAIVNDLQMWRQGEEPAMQPFGNALSEPLQSGSVR
jgi:hypothetical protein